MRKLHFLVPLLYLLAASAALRFTLLGGGYWDGVLAKPAGAPTTWAFALSWPLFYLLAAWSFLLFAGQAAGSASFGAGVRVYLMQAVLGVSFSYLFFVRQLLGPAVLVAAFFAGSIVLAMILARPHSFRATLVALPCFLWGAFLTSLAHEIFQLNR